MISFLLGCFTQQGWLNSRQSSVFYCLYNVVKQVLTPPLYLLTTQQLKEVIIGTNEAGYWFPHEQQIICYGNEEYLPCHNTKYIFWLGKNKFDKQMAPCIIEGMEAEK